MLLRSESVTENHIWKPTGGQINVTDCVRLQGKEWKDVLLSEAKRGFFLSTALEIRQIQM